MTGGDEQRTAHAPEGAKLWGLVVTYRRPEELGRMLDTLGSQTRGLDRLLVVDNGSDNSVRLLAEENGLLYVDAGDNLGPAGAIHLGLNLIADQAGDDDWVMLLDDDDPPHRADLIAGMWGFAHWALEYFDNVGAVGLVGARYDSRRGRLVRVPDSELTGAVAVDYIGGGQFPLYRVSAVRSAGAGDPSFFFGFDDVELGMSMRAAGYAIYCHGDFWRERRDYFGKIGLSPRRIRTDPRTSSWRQYYSVRNATVLAKRYAAPLRYLPIGAMAALLATLRIARQRRPLREVALPARGYVDAIRGRCGRTVEPVAHP